MGGITGALYDATVGQVVGPNSISGKLYDAANSTISNILKNPLPTIETAALMAVGVDPTIASAAVSAMNGGSVQDIALAAATSYAAQQAGGYAGNQYSPIETQTLQQLGPQYADELLIKQIITSSSGAAAATALRGGSMDQILTSAVSASIAPAVSAALKEQYGVTGLDNKILSNSISAATKAILNGQSVADAVGQSAAATAISAGIQSGVNSLNEKYGVANSLKSSFDSLRGDAQKAYENLASTKSTLDSQVQTTNELVNDFNTKQAAYNDEYNNWKSLYDAASSDAGYAAYAQNLGYQLMDTGAPDGSGFYAKVVGTEKIPLWDGGDLVEVPIFENPPDRNSLIDQANAKIDVLNKMAGDVKNSYDAATSAVASLGSSKTAYENDLQAYNTNYVEKLNDLKSQYDTVNQDIASISAKLGEDVSAYQQEAVAGAEPIAEQITSKAIEEAQQALAGGAGESTGSTAPTDLSDAAKQDYLDLVANGTDPDHAYAIAKAFDTAQPTGGGEQVAGPAGMTAATVASMPEMQPRQGETASDIRESDGTYRRTITTENYDGTKSSYDIVYDPEAATGRQIGYELGGVNVDKDGQVIPGVGITSFTYTRPEAFPEPTDTNTPPADNFDYLDLDKIQQAIFGQAIDSGATPQEAYALAKQSTTPGGGETTPIDIGTAPGGTGEAIQPGVGGEATAPGTGGTETVPADTGALPSDTGTPGGTGTTTVGTGALPGDTGTQPGTGGTGIDSSSGSGTGVLPGGTVGVPGGTGSGEGGTGLSGTGTETPPDSTQPGGTTGGTTGGGTSGGTTGGATVIPTSTTQVGQQQASINPLDPKFLKVENPWLVTKATPQKGVEQQQLKQIYDQLDPELKDVFSNKANEDVQAAIGGSIHPELASVLGLHGYADGGSFSALSDFQKSMQDANPQFVKNVAPAFLTIGTGKKSPIQMQELPQLQLGKKMAKGGLPSKYSEAAPDGHKPEFITGLTGYYAGGRGTGQSDDIPAMLHDGDYVIDAEAVSAFGDGSSKAGKDVLMHFLGQVPHKDGALGNPVPAKIADGEVVLPESFVTALGGGDNKRGAQMLDQMRENLRQHKRSAPTSKIPPKAKSPLDYLKGVKG